MNLSAAVVHSFLLIGKTNFLKVTECVWIGYFSSSREVDRLLGTRVMNVCILCVLQLYGCTKSLASGECLMW